MVSGDFLFFEHVHPDKVLKNKLKIRDANLGRIKLSSPSSYGDTREKRARERDMDAFVAVQWQITFSQADNIEPWQITHFNFFCGFISHFKYI